MKEIAVYRGVGSSPLPKKKSFAEELSLLQEKYHDKRVMKVEKDFQKKIAWRAKKADKIIKVCRKYLIKEVKETAHTSVVFKIQREAIEVYGKSIKYFFFSIPRYELNKIISLVEEIFSNEGFQTEITHDKRFVYLTIKW